MNKTKSELEEKYPTVQKWINGLKRTSRKKRIVKSTRDACISAMEQYLEFLGSGNIEMTPDDLIEEARRDTEKTEERLSDFFNWLQGFEVEGYRPRMKKGKRRKLSYASARQIAYSRIQGFYSHNRISFEKGITPSKVKSQVQDVDEVHPVFVYNEEMKKIEADFSVIRQILGNLSFRDQTITLCLLSTSQDPVDLFNLTVGFVRDRVKAKQKRFFWSGNRIKTVEPYKTFFSAEASEMLRQYIEQERRDASDEEKLFVKRNGDPMEVHSFCAILRDVQSKMGLVKAKQHSPFRPKRFRHIFRDSSATAGIDIGYTHAFMGHASDISSGYLNKPQAVLEAQYIRVEPYLSIFRSTLEQDIDTINARLKESEEQLDKLKDSMLWRDEEIHTLRKDLKEHQEAIDMIPEMIDKVIDRKLEQLNLRPEENIAEIENAKARIDNILALVKEKVK